MADSDRPCPACATPVPIDAVSCPSCGALSLPNAGDGGDLIAERLSRAVGQRYRIERELGRGGMAVVLLAHDLRHDRPVAIKVLLPELSRFLGLERFLREIHIAAQLNHPHILALHDSGEADGLLFYVMPYVEGGSLRRRLVREGPLPIAETGRIAAEVADGLAYAHQHGVVHRDIKPENILLTERHAVIADFGIARAIHAVGGSSTITSTGISLGTPAYMSPEQATGDAAVDHRTDIYALGCTLYETLTGGPPFPGPTPQALIAQHLTDPVPSARAVRPDVPPALDAAVRRAMAKAPSDRFQSAAEFGAALGGAPVAAGPGAPYARPARARRLRAFAAGATVLAVAGAAALLLRGHGPGAAPPASRAPLRVVVRPFAVRSDVLRPTAERITEALTDLLRPVPALAVTANAVVADLGDVSLDTLRARLAPDRIVVGRVETVRGELRVSAQIVDARSGRALADSSLTAPRGADVATAVAAPLSVFVRHAFWAELDREARRARVRDSTTWDLIERAQGLDDAAARAVTERLDRMGFRSLDVADSLLREAQARDGASDLVPIERAHLADRRAFFAEYLVQVLRIPPTDLPAPAAERARALTLLDRLIREHRGPADAFELRGQVKEGLWRVVGTDSLLDGAIADYRSATELDQHSATAWLALGFALRNADRYAEALLALERASEEDVFQLHRPNLLRSRFDAALAAQRYDIAAEACREGLAASPDDERFQDCELQLWSRTRADRRSASLARARAEALAAHDRGTLAAAMRDVWVAEILARGGQGDSADQVAGRVLAAAPAGWLPFLLPETAYLRLLRRDPDSAVALIIAAARQGPTTRRFLRHAAEFQPLRADPRFAAAVRDSASAP